MVRFYSRRLLRVSKFGYCVPLPEALLGPVSRTPKFTAISGLFSVLYLAAVCQLIAFWFALMGPDEVQKLVFLQELLCYVGSKVSSSSS